MKSAENVAVDAVTSDKFPSLKSVGFHPRTPTLGAEYSMVKDYAEKIIAENFKGNGLDESIIVFVEPRMESAFPDLVVAYYHEELLSAWSETRRHLNKTDLKVMHHIYCKGAVKTAEIKNIFPGSALKSLRRLSNSGLIFGDGKDWKSAPVHEVFAVYKIVAIEAKINDWRSGISQAFRNTWFASEVYLLLPSIRNKGQILDEALSKGVGVLEQASISPVLFPRTEHSSSILPKSYGSWMFNEWVWRIWRDSNQF